MLRAGRTSIVVIQAATVIVTRCFDAALLKFPRGYTFLRYRSDRDGDRSDLDGARSDLDSACSASTALQVACL